MNKRMLIQAAAVCLALGFAAGVLTGLRLFAPGRHGRDSDATATETTATAAGTATAPAETVLAPTSATATPTGPAQDQASAQVLAPGLAAMDSGVEAASAREPETMIMPVEGRIVGEYGWHRNRVTDDWRFRDGLDISCAAGTKVMAALSGVVTEASRATSGGCSVSLKHAGDLETRYENMRAAWVDVGQQVTVGTLIGDIGAASLGKEGVVRFAVKCGGESMDPAVCLGQRF